MKFKHKTNFWLAVASSVVVTIFNFWLHGSAWGAVFAAVFTFFFCWGFNYLVDVACDAVRRWRARPGNHPQDPTS